MYLCLWLWFGLVSLGLVRLPSPGSDDHSKQITGSLPDKPSRVCWDPSPLFIYSIYGHILLGLFHLLLSHSRNNKNIQNINSQKNILCAILEMNSRGQSGFAIISPKDGWKLPKVQDDRLFCLFQTNLFCLSCFRSRIDGILYCPFRSPKRRQSPPIPCMLISEQSQRTCPTYIHVYSYPPVIWTPTPTHPPNPTTRGMVGTFPQHECELPGKFPVSGAKILSEVPAPGYSAAQPAQSPKCVESAVTAFLKSPR